MNDYLKSLFEHFSTALGQPDDLHQAEAEAFNALHAELDDAKQRKLLLRLRDAEDAKREVAAYSYEDDASTKGRKASIAS